MPLKCLSVRVKSLSVRVNSLSRSVLILMSAAVLGSAVHAQTAVPVRTEARPAVRITQKIDNSVTTALTGTHPAIVEHAAVGSRLAATMALPHLQLVLSPTDAQVTAFETLLEQQQDKTSPNYHHWLTPDTYAQYFGVAPADVASVTAWLEDQGFTINSVAKGNRIITFSGTVAQVETAFHTEMHSVTINGAVHVSNTSDIQVPQAFVGVVRGVASLNDFFPKADAVGARKVEFTAGSAQGQETPLVGTPSYTSTSSGSHYVAPGDAAIIYNSTPLLKAGIDGTGQTIAVLGRTDVSLADVQQFRSMFGLKKNDPTFTVVGEDPGINTDDIEAYLDVEWAGGMAPGAAVNFIVGGTDYVTTGGINSAGLYAVDNNIGDIITLSYGGCETNNGASGTAFWNTLWEQAAAQGQTVFVSSGDSSAAGCSSSSAATGAAYGVNALGSSAYNVAVGGTMFVDYGPNQYWSPGTLAPAPPGYTFTTALSYVPEAVWNQGLLSTTYLNTLSTAPVTGSGIAGGGGGISIYTARPPWQTGSGISATADSSCASGTCIAASSPITGVHRLVPDISFIAASGHDATVFCAESSCYNSSAGFGIGAVGGTSVATPVMASVQALINQKNGGRQGNANFYYYPLANADYTAGNCKAVNGTAAAPAVTPPASTCNFHDTVAGSNIIPTNAAGTTSLGFAAGIGFDAASGLGSVNINNVATNWSKVNFNATTTTFTLTPTVGITHGATQALTVSVTSTAGTPTGDVSLIAVTSKPGAKLQYTLSSGAYSGNITGLPAGTYYIYARYEGDGTFAASNSYAQQVTIGQETSTVALNLYYFIPGTYYSNPTSVPYGDLTDLTGTVAGASGTGTPSGTLTFAISQNGSTLSPYTGTLDSSATAALVAGAGYSALYIAPNYPALGPGNYVVTATYSGDTSFATSAGTLTFTVTQQTPTVTASSSAAYITSGAAVTLNCTAARVALTPPLAAYPSGTCTFKDTTTGTTLGTANLNGVGIGSLSTTAITTSGANAITATYNGDANYAANTSTNTASVTVGTLTPTTTTVAVTAGTYYVLSTTPIVATVSPAVGGNVSFYDGSVLLGTAAASATTGIATLNTTALTAGTHTLTASFVGTTAYTASTGTTSLLVNQNVTSIILDAPAYSIAGQPIALNGRVARAPTQSSAGTVLLTGAVTFYDGTTAIATATPVYLPGGYYYYVATATSYTLARGVHTLTASYGGDANFAPSNSGSVTLTVTPDNVWVANSTGSVGGLMTTGTVFASPAGGGTGIAIDNAGDVWSLNKSGSSVAEFSNLGGVLNAGYSGGGISTPTALAIDGSGSVWIANSNSTVSVLSNAGLAASPSGGYPSTTATPTSVTIDASGNLWITNSGDNSLTEIVGAAAPVMTPMTTAVTNNNLATKP